MPGGRTRQGHREDVALALALRRGELSLEEAVAHEMARRNGNGTANTATEARRHILLITRLYGSGAGANTEHLAEQTQQPQPPEETPRSIKDTNYILVADEDQARLYQRSLTPFGAKILDHLITAESAPRSALRKAVQNEHGYREDKLFKTLNRFVGEGIVRAEQVYE